MVSPRHYTVDPMLSASGNLFKCHEEVLFYFFTCCIGTLVSYSIPEVFCLSGGGDSFLFIFLKTKKNEKKHPRSESNPAFQSAREMLARFSRGFIHAPGVPIELKPWLAWAS